MAPPALPRINKANIPGVPLHGVVTYGDNFSVRRGGVPAPTPVTPGEPPPYDIEPEEGRKAADSS